MRVSACPCICVWRPEVNISDFLSWSPLNLLRQDLSLNLELNNRPDWLASETLESNWLSLPLLQRHSHRGMPPCLTFRQCWKSELGSSCFQTSTLPSQHLHSSAFHFLSWKPSVRPVSQSSFLCLKTQATTGPFSPKISISQKQHKSMSYQTSLRFTTDVSSSTQGLVVQCSSPTGPHRKCPKLCRCEEGRRCGAEDHHT